MAKGTINFDWVTILLYLVLISFGWINIYSASLGDSPSGIFDVNQIYGKQALWIILGFFMIVIILSIEAKFYIKFSSVFYIISLLSILGLFAFGKTINGATSWYVFGGISIQPAEFAKVGTTLALANYLGDIQTNMKLFSNQLKAFFIIALPALIILPQPDAGSAMVYAAFLFPLYREGLSGIYLFLGFAAVAIFVLTLVISPLYVAAAVIVISLLTLLQKKRKRPGYSVLLAIIISSIALSYSVDYIFQNVFEQRHRDRFNIVLGKEVDARGIGYNTNQSEIAIGSGGWLGKGWTEGTQTKGQFVPEQHTDYIFSTVGEEWGFLGTSLVILLFIGLLFRLLFLAERQKATFNRVYGYSLVGIIFIHFLVNIGMVTGIFPTVGIPLPFFSYGGSGLWGFTILLFIFIKLDSERMAF
jgi:rod shape determining protein RodA